MLQLLWRELKKQFFAAYLYDATIDWYAANSLLREADFIGETLPFTQRDYTFDFDRTVTLDPTHNYQIRFGVGGLRIFGSANSQSYPKGDWNGIPDEVLKDIYFVLNSDTPPPPTFPPLAQTDDSAVSFSSAPYWQQTLGNGLDFNVKDLTIRVKNQGDAYYAGTIYGFPTADYASGYGVTPLEQYSFANLGPSTPSGFDGKVTLSMQGNSLLSFPLNPNRYYEIFLSGSWGSYIYGSSQDSYPNGKAYYSDYWSYPNCRFTPYFNPEGNCGLGTNNGIADIFFQFGTAETLSGKESAVATSDGQRAPVIDGDLIAWTDDVDSDPSRSIYVYEISTGRKIRITNDGSIKTTLMLANRKILWNVYLSPYSSVDKATFIYDFDTATTTEITERIGTRITVSDFDGQRIVLQTGYISPTSIYLYDLDTSRLTLIDSDDPDKAQDDLRNPKISGNKILYLWNYVCGTWCQQQELRLYDITTKEKTLIFNNYGNNSDYAINGDNIIAVFNTTTGSNNEKLISRHKISTGEETTTISPPYQQIEGIDISENFVVWSDTYDVFVYDLATGRTDRTGMAPGASLHPKIYGNNIVWEDYRVATGPEIYMYRLASQNQPNHAPTLSFSTIDSYAEDGIDPNKGDVETEFTFKTVYTDADNDSPQTISLIVGDGIATTTRVLTLDASAPLELRDGNYTNGEQFSATSTFSKKAQRFYHFETSDGKSDAARIPENGNLQFSVINVSVIIVPGIMGSNLVGVGDIERQEPYWPPLRDDVFLPLISPTIYKLSLGEDGHTRQAVDFLGDYNVMDASSIIRKYEDEDVFESLFETLVDNYGYKEGEDLFEFPYDWRLDITESALFLQKKIEEIGADKVDIIAHSQGGLVSKFYIANNSRGKVRKFIDIATPHLGTPKAFKTLMWGDDLGQQLSWFEQSLFEPKMQSISQNMPSVYQLLPSENYFMNDQNYQYYFFNGDNIKIPPGPLSYDQSMQYLISEGRNENSSEWNRTLHDSIDNWNGADYGVEETTNIVGCKTATIGQIFTFSKNKNTSETLDEGLKKGYALHYISGDDTVPLRSADHLSPVAQWEFYIPDAKHGEMPSSVPALEIISAVLSGNKSVLDALENKYGDKNSDNCKFEGEEVAFFSPVDVHIYDKDGRHTGIMFDGTIEKNIPGVAYDILNDEKFIFLPTGREYTITGKATSLGSFDARIKKIEDEKVTETFYYNEIPLTTLNTNIELDVAPNQADYTFQIDQNGDNVFESNAEPSAVLNTEESNDITQPITEILIEGSKLNGENWYGDNVTASLTATDDNAGILKTEYSLDGGQTWSIYSIPLHITKEGTTTISYFSTDRAGNKENMKHKDVLKITDVTIISKIVQSGARFNRRTGQYSIRATWKNTGGDSFLQPLQMVIEKITPSTVTVVNADGATDGGKSYFDFSNTVRDGALASKKTSSSKDLIFNNPSRVRFSFDVSFWARKD